MDELKLWGKACIDESGKIIWHPLAYHMLDVAAVAEVWLKEDSNLFDLFSQLATIPSKSLIPILALSTALHDVGKATVGFQNKIPDLAKDFGLEDTSAQNIKFDHGIFGIHWIEDMREEESEYSYLLKKYSILNDESFLSLWKAACWHHGNLIKYSDSEKYSNGFKEKNSKKNPIFQLSAKFRNEVLEFITDAILQDNPIESSLPTLSPSTVRLFAGFVSVCDWIGSDRKYFEFNSNPHTSKEYYQLAKLNAIKALKDLEILAKLPDNFLDFKDLYPKISAQRPVQTKTTRFKKSNKSLLAYSRSANRRG
jgi:CRISPR-associated endonuclease/helicase Cas3